MTLAKILGLAVLVFFAGTAQEAWAHGYYIITKKEKLLPTTTAKCPVTTDNPEQPQCFKYVVKKGDTLSGIAARFDSKAGRKYWGKKLTAKMLLEIPANEAFRKNPDLIFSGMLVTLPYVAEEEGRRFAKVTSGKESRDLLERIKAVEKERDTYRLLFYVGVVIASFFAITSGVLFVAWLRRV